jgi:hypothetical protein
MVRDLFHISGKVRIDTAGKILEITLNQDHIHATQFLAGIAPALASCDLLLNLHEI